MYKIEIGIFSARAEIRTEEGHLMRDFIPLFHMELTEGELVDKMILFAEGWKPIMLENWLHTEDRPRTFLLAGKESGQGYRITKVENTVKNQNSNPISVNEP